jgi:hypothetical protein
MLCKFVMICIIQTFRNVLSLTYLDAGLIAWPVAMAGFATRVSVKIVKSRVKSTYYNYHKWYFTVVVIDSCIVRSVYGRDGYSMIWLGGGGGGGPALPALVPSCVGHVRRPPINFLDYCKVLLEYCIWVVIVVQRVRLSWCYWLKLLDLIFSG